MHASGVCLSDVAFAIRPGIGGVRSTSTPVDDRIFT